jgi:hypothetical protein
MIALNEGGKIPGYMYWYKHNITNYGRVQLEAYFKRANHLPRLRENVKDMEFVITLTWASILNKGFIVIPYPRKDGTFLSDLPYNDQTLSHCKRSITTLRMRSFNKLSNPHDKSVWQ